MPCSYKQHSGNQCVCVLSSSCSSFFCALYYARAKQPSIYDDFMRVRIIGRPSLASARCDADKHMSAILSKVHRTVIKPCEWGGYDIAMALLCSAAPLIFQLVCCAEPLLSCPLPLRGGARVGTLISCQQICYRLFSFRGKS